MLGWFGVNVCACVSVRDTRRARRGFRCRITCLCVRRAECACGPDRCVCVCALMCGRVHTAEGDNREREKRRKKKRVTVRESEKLFPLISSQHRVLHICRTCTAFTRIWSTRRTHHRTRTRTHTHPHTQHIVRDHSNIYTLCIYCIYGRHPCKQRKWCQQQSRSAYARGPREQRTKKGFA